MTALIVMTQLLTAAGLIGFWVRWFRVTHEEPWLPIGFENHERVFVWPDSIAAVLLVVSAAGTLAGWSGSAITSYVAAGMLLFLVIIDTAYYAQHGMLRLEHDGLANAAIMVGASAAALASIWYHAFGT